jgi:hypothetical protein
MANGFGFCPNCGAPRAVANEKFCAECGTALPPHATPAAPQPQAAPPPPAGAPPIPPPPTWVAPPQQPPQAPVYQAPVYVTQAPAPKAGISPMVALAAVVVIVVAIGGAYVVMNQNKASPSPAASGLFGSLAPSDSTTAAPTEASTATPVVETPVPTSQGVITFEPASFDCASTTTQVKVSVWLPATLGASDNITGELDGTKLGASAIGDSYSQLADGRWYETTTNSAADLCGTEMAAGQHTVRILDDNDKELARGFFVNTHGGAAQTTGSLTISPSVFSCSSAGQVQIVVVLPASLAGSDQITIKLDGASSGSEAVEDEFEIQPDGTWQYTDSTSIATICGEVSVGKHTFVISDSLGKVLAQGSFTTQP